MSDPVLAGSYREQPDLSGHASPPVSGDSPGEVPFMSVLEETQDTTQGAGKDFSVGEIDHCPEATLPKIQHQPKPYFNIPPQTRAEDEVAAEWSFALAQKHTPVVFGNPARGNQHTGRELRDTEDDASTPKEELPSPERPFAQEERASNTSKRLARRFDEHCERSSPSLSERNVRFDQFRTVFNQLSTYDHELMANQNYKISQLKEKVQKRDAYIHATKQELKEQVALIHQLQKEKHELKSQSHTSEELASKTGDRLNQLKEKYHILKSHANNALREQQSFYQQTQRMVEDTMSTIKREAEAYQAKQAEVVEEAEQIRERFREKTKQALTDAREHCKKLEARSQTLQEKLELSNEEKSQAMAMASKLQKELQMVKENNEIVLQQLAKQSRDILDILSTEHEQSLIGGLALEHHGDKLNELADLLLKQESGGISHEAIHDVVKGVLDEAMSRLSTDVRATAAALKSSITRDIPNQSSQLERIESACQSIQAHFDEAKTSHFWHQKFTDADAVSLAQAALIEDLQNQLHEHTSTQAEVDRLTAAAKDSHVLLLEKDKVISKQKQDLSTLREELEIRSGMNEATEEKLNEAQQNHKQYVQTIHDKIEELTEKLEEAEQLELEHEAMSKRKDETIAKLSTELAVKDGRLQALEEQLGEVRQKFEQHNQSLHEQQAQNLLQAINSNAGKFEKERSELNKQLKAANLANEQLQQELSSRARELQELENQARDGELEREEAQRHAAEEEFERQKLLDATTSQMGAVEAERLILQGQVQSAKEEVKKLSQELSDARMTIEEVQAQSEQATTATHSLTKEKTELQGYLELAKADAHRLQQALLEAERTVGETRAQMGDAVATEMAKALRIADEALSAFQTSQITEEGGGIPHCCFGAEGPDDV
ncbi:hypothetical protein Micbo1qcDRAFT_199820 [Microdochium bolleyi]|uniref:Uncharacterized protein n=1 Tax=Microdochium bolleyi TaxID=196109 RepID=A0A136JIV5_9PEZI|nr:hypothetical protein Micbo1qcDRAFT_199820 [Microdochium bolleyi]